MARLNRVQHVVLAVLATGACLWAVTGPSRAASTGKLAAQTVDSDAFDNYDLLSASVAWNNVDWPINLMFYNNANINKIKNTLNPLFNVGPPWASPMYGRIKNTGTWFYDQDSGRKTAVAICGLIGHYRIYADSANSDRNWSPSLGYYVIGSSHYDYNEEGCGSTGQWFGNSESAEDWVANASSAYGGWSIYRDYWPLNNYESSRWEGNHWWVSDGRATLVGIP